ncbi:MAG: cysteine dioxygenase family protein, partial [Bacteroidota bacterium]
DHPVEDGYGRKMVHDAGHFEVMVMSWSPGDYSSIHNHGYTQWGVVQVFGHTHHFIFNLKENHLSFCKKEILTNKSVVKVNNALIHQMGNATSTPYMTLHVYGANDRSEAVTADAKNFELEFDRVAHTTGGAFFNLPETEIYDFEAGPQPSNEVLIHYGQLLLNYYQRQPHSAKTERLKQNILTKLEQALLRHPQIQHSQGKMAG